MADSPAGLATETGGRITATTSSRDSANSSAGQARHAHRAGAPSVRRWSGATQAVAELSAEERAETGTRGALEVKDKAVERIAEAAVTEVPDVIAADATAGTIATALGRSYPRVDVHVAGHRARVKVDIVTAWPRPAADVAAAVRDHVAERLHTLADLDVDVVDVAVAKVLRPITPERRRVQ